MGIPLPPSFSAPQSSTPKAGLPLPPSYPTPQSSPPKAGRPPPAVILGTPVVPTEGGTTGVSGIQWLLQVAPTVVSPQRVLLPPPSGLKKVGMPPPAVRIKVGGDAPPAVILGTPVVHAEGVDDWGVGNPAALASSPYCRFTSARLAPAPVRIKEGGDAPSRRHSRHPSRPRQRRDDWGVGNPAALASSPYCHFTSARLAPAPVRIKEGGDAPSRRQDQSRRESSKKSIAFSL